MDAWGDIHKCGPVKIRDLQNAGNILQEQETENCRPCKTQAAIGVEMEQEIETCPACRQDQSLTNFELSKTQNAFAIRNLLPRKLDPPDTLNEVAVATLALTGFQHVLRVGEMRGHSALLSALVERWRPETHTFHLSVGEVTVTLEDVSYILGLPINGDAVTGRSDSSHQFLVENCIACFGRESGPDDHVLGKVNIAWVRRCRDTEPCDTQESLERYVRAHIFCMLGTVVFPDKSTVSLNSKFLPLLRDFHRISGYSWGAASLAHLYRSSCRASRYNCKKMDGPLILLFVWAWEHMPFLAPIPRDQLGNIGVPLARRWSHWRRHTRYIRRPITHFRRGLDDMGINDFIWRPYMGVGIPDGLEPHMFICSTQSPLVSFECIEWHATDRVRRQFGMQQLPPGPAFNLGRDHCKRLTGAQNHYWGQIYSQWVNRWTFDRYNTLQLGEEIIDFHPLPVYYDWYTQQYGIHLRLSDRVPGGEIGADEPQQQQEEPAGPHQGVPPHEQQEQVLFLIPSIMVIRFINSYQ
ncbi:uncharacterized protein DS421_19g668960 [Arachis hypogaea]|uniref:Aminotransferase-like plant mobile domain-containing protein n=1 Tax=Arachis hypogaea TaxID=3818 RepID=A0A6B9VBQ5_ARAHY|nr:uncharacterized protein DS421_19g668960 [Arachis hypogaea]